MPRGRGGAGEAGPVGICSPKTGPSPHSWAWNWGVEGGKDTPRKGGCQSQVYVFGRGGGLSGKSSSALSIP